MPAISLARAANMTGLHMHELNFTPESWAKFLEFMSTIYAWPYLTLTWQSTTVHIFAQVVLWQQLLHTFASARLLVTSKQQALRTWSKCFRGGLNIWTGGSVHFGGPNISWQVNWFQLMLAVQVLYAWSGKGKIVVFWRVCTSSDVLYILWWPWTGKAKLGSFQLDYVWA